MKKHKRIPPHIAERAATRCTVADNGCWESTYAIDAKGYCKIGWKDAGSYRSSSAHRAAWAHYNGHEIPEDVNITQTCGNEMCVHPDHLKTIPLNQARGRGKKTQCGRGHGPENWVKVGKRHRCKVCRRESMRKSRERRRIKGGVRGRFSGSAWKSGSE